MAEFQARGNELFKARKFAEALQSYEKGLAVAEAESKESDIVEQQRRRPDRARQIQRGLGARRRGLGGGRRRLSIPPQG